ncbi:MAG: hypothetical protein ACX93N_15375 [Pseudohaliea sp.]
MKQKALSLTVGLLLAISFTANADREVGTSPWGPADEIGRLNLMNESSRAAVNRSGFVGGSRP